MDKGVESGVGSASQAGFWWESRAAIAAAILLAFVPLLYPPVPPLVDLLGHIGRYRVELDLANSVHLQRYYDFQWAPIGNLGIDLLIYPLGKLLGLEPAVKLIVILIAPLTVVGLLWVAYEVHHKIPPTAYFSLPFIFGYPFLFGFVNFALSMALAFLAFGLWLRLARKGRLKLRALLFVPISFVLYFCHTFGWGTLGLLCFSAEAVRQHDEGRSWWRAGLMAVPHALVMIGPALLILAWRSDIGGQAMTRSWFDWDYKAAWIRSALRDRWRMFDVGMVWVAALALLTAVFTPRLSFSRNLAFTALVLFGAFIVLPWTVFGSAFADMRLVPYFIAVALLAIRVKPGQRFANAGVLAAAAMTFWTVKVAATTVSLGMASSALDARMGALDAVPRGARLVTLVGMDCRSLWPLYRNSHIASMALARREAFANDQWAIPGLNLLHVKYAEAGYFRNDSSEMVRADNCPLRTIRPVNASLRDIPRDAFDFLWMVDAPPFDPALIADMKVIWRGPGSVLYRIER